MSEAGGEECGDAITPLIWLYETSDSEGSSARKVDNGAVACFDLYQIISFISVMTHIGVGESFLFTSHTMLLSPSYKCYMFHVLSEFRSDKFQSKQILGCKNFLKLLFFNMLHLHVSCPALR